MTSFEPHPAESEGEARSTTGSDKRANQKRTFKSLTYDFFTPKPPNRGEATSAPVSVREIINGLDRRENLLGTVATVCAFALAGLGYYSDSHSTNATIHANAGDFLMGMLIAAFFLGLGTVFRRRALVGFAAFFFGLEQISFDSIYLGVVYLAFGGWLIWRVMQKGKIDSANRLTKQAVSARTRTPGQPAKASKRYTPPKTNRPRGR